MYGSAEVLGVVRKMAKKLLPPAQLRCMDGPLHLVPVQDGQVCRILGRTVTFFDIGSKKKEQFGFQMDLGRKRRLVCLGDEPCTKRGEPYARGCDWLLHEAFCLSSDAASLDPYGKNHSTVMDAAKNAQTLDAKNLLLYHTEDSDLPHRKERYGAEAQSFFSGNVFVPSDLETLVL